MIVADHGSTLVVCTQPDHAQLSAALLALWRRDGIPEHPRRNELLFAVREHDNGWQRADAAPRVSGASGWPTSFDNVPPSDRLEVWRRSVHRFVTDHPYAALLIAQHALAVNQRYFQAPGWPGFRVELEEQINQAIEETSLTTADLAADYTWLRLTDTLSLGACGALGATDAFVDEQSGYRYALERGRIRIAPLPLAGATTLEIACRELPKRRFSDTSDLTSELSRAVWQRRPVRIELLEEA